MNAGTGRTSTPVIPKTFIDKAKQEIVKIIRDWKVPEWVSKGNVTYELSARNVIVEGHDSYFSRIVNEGIIEARVDGWKYIPWSNLTRGSRSRSYKRVRA